MIEMFEERNGTFHKKDNVDHNEDKEQKIEIDNWMIICKAL